MTDEAETQELPMDHPTSNDVGDQTATKADAAEVEATDADDDDDADDDGNEPI